MTLGPTLSNKAPINGDKNPFNRLPGSIAIPTTAAETSIVVCMYTGRIISVANIVITIIRNIAIACKNNGYFSTRKFMIGSSNLNCLHANKTIAKRPIMIDTITTGLLNPVSDCPTELNPYMVPPNPIVDKRTDSTSILGFVTSDTLTRYLLAKMSANRTHGTTIMNRYLHPRYSTMTPDNVGPIAGANIITNPIIPMILPRTAGLYITSITLNNTGINAPVPTA